ncbi:MAG: CcoQ/FixQ family Cbb3-type cytochrome c oxidase assembly chaperone [Pseudomonadota bacterium]
MSILISVGTLICFTFFIAIVFRAYSRRQQSAYSEAASIPFDLPDEFSEKVSDKAGYVSPSNTAKGETA